MIRSVCHTLVSCLLLHKGAANVIPSVQTVWLPWRSDIGISLLEMVTTQTRLALHLLNRGCLEHYSVSWWAHEGTTEHSGVYFYTEEEQAKSQNRPEFTLSMETSSNFLSLNIQLWDFSASKIIYTAWKLLKRRKTDYFTTSWLEGNLFM